MFIIENSIVFCLILFSLSIKSVLPIKESKRPFYNLAHMTNSPKNINIALEEGANGIEFDVQFNSEGKPLNVYHGYICDCFRKCDTWSNFVPFLQYIRNITTPSHQDFNEKFILAFIDLKTNTFLNEFMRITAGKKLFDSLVEHLFNFGQIQTQIKIVLSVLTTYDEYFIRGFMDSMKSRKLDFINDYIGWDISNGEALGAIRFTYKRLLKSYDLNIWQSDGITNCLNAIAPRDRVSSAVEIRNSKYSYMSKVCLWTIDIEQQMRQSLRIGVDAVLTNYPDSFLNVLNEEEFSGKYRLATKDDNPWLKYD